MSDHTNSREATEAQKRCLSQMGISFPDDISGRDAFIRILARKDEWANLDPTSCQEYVLRKHGVWRDGIKRGEATDLIGQLKRNSPKEP